MADHKLPGGVDPEKAPNKALLKRIDIGLTTGLIAVTIAFISLLTSRSQAKLALETQKARVLPIIAVDMGYENVGDRRNAVFVVRLNNLGAGLANIRRVVPLKNGEPIADIADFDAAIMNRRMRSNVGYPAVSHAAGYLRAGDSREPRRYRMGAAGSELGAYLRGDYGPPLGGLDLDVCYCSVFDDCWSVRHSSRIPPKPVKSCEVDGAPVDYFQTYIDQTAAKRLAQ